MLREDGFELTAAEYLFCNDGEYNMENWKNQDFIRIEKIVKNSENTCKNITKNRSPNMLSYKKQTFFGKRGYKKKGEEV